ncbi:MAG: hypothetical protein IPG71_00340 [bacterium]|nr:hypothetical protein [bacterium]
MLPWTTLVLVLLGGIVTHTNAGIDGGLDGKALGAVGRFYLIVDFGGANIGVTSLEIENAILQRLRANGIEVADKSDPDAVEFLYLNFSYIPTGLTSAAFSFQLSMVQLVRTAKEPSTICFAKTWETNGGRLGWADTIQKLQEETFRFIFVATDDFVADYKLALRK